MSPRLFLRHLPFALAVSACLPAGAAVEESPPPRFDVMEYAIEGNTVLPAIDIERAVYPHLGPQLTLADVERARAALERSYQDAGYRTVAVEIPEQRADDGVIRLRVVEGRIGQVRVTGSRYYSQGRILAQAAAADEGEVPYFGALQRDLQGLNRAGGRRVVPVLRPGKSPGTTDIDFSVEDKPPLSGNLEASNQYSPNTTHSRLSGSVRYDNLWQREHGLSLQFQTTPEDTGETKAFSASYIAPLDSGDALAAYGVYSDSNVAALGSTSVLGRGKIFGLRHIHPLAARSGISQSLTLGIDYKDFKENVVFAGSPAINTPIRYLPFSASYAIGIEDGDGRWDISTGVGLSFRGMVSDEKEFRNKGNDSHASYLVWKWDIARSQSLGKSFGLHARFDGQVTDQHLVSNEQFGAGGVGSVRGYLQSEALADDGNHLALELRGPAWREWSMELRPHAFLEGAWLRNHTGPQSPEQRVELASTGFGFSLRAWNRLALTLNLGWPMRATGYTPSWQPRLQCSSTLEF